MRRFLISEMACEAFKSRLAGLGQVLEVPADDRVYPAIASHSDIFACVVAGRLFIDSRLAERLEARGERLPDSAVRLSGLIGGAYPATVPFNNRQIGRHLLHNLRHMPEAVRLHAEGAGLELVHVNQGYTGCSTLALDAGHLVTADKGIAAAAEARGIKTLSIRPGGIRLDGAMEGFIGGAAAATGTAVLFHGDLDSHPDSGRIKAFIKAAGFSWESLGGMPLTDMGGAVQWQDI